MLKIKNFFLKNMILIGFVTILISYEVISKDAPFSESWIFILLLLCPIGHAFMHKKHGNHNLKKDEE